jgi:hypothetical protein
MKNRIILLITGLALVGVTVGCVYPENGGGRGRGRDRGEHRERGPEREREHEREHGNAQ